ncbi:MAG: iron-sulfur cluster assembly scaffold protein [Thermodesulfobacteriota bacterium]
MNGVNEDFFEKHSKNYLEMAFSSERSEYVENPDGYGCKTGECGDTITFYLTLSGEKLEFVSYQVNGCINTNACSATLSKLTEGKSIDEAWEITPEDIADYLETLPEDEIHCAELAAGAFFLALNDAGKKATDNVF